MELTQNAVPHKNVRVSIRKLRDKKSNAVETVSYVTYANVRSEQNRNHRNRMII